MAEQNSVSLSRAGRKGARSRAKKLTATQRRKIAQHAALVRWAKKKPEV